MTSAVRFQTNEPATARDRLAIAVINVVALGFLLSLPWTVGSPDLKINTYVEYPAPPSVVCNER